MANSDCMYLDYFGLREPPFLLTPDAEFLFLSRQHAQAKACMEYTVLNRDSFVVVTGEIGCGKTTLINKMVMELGHNIVVARVFQTQLGPVEFLQSVLVQFGYKPFDRSKAELIALLNKYLESQHRLGHHVVLIVDEAQHLSVEVLEEIRLLTDLQVDGDKVLSVLLVGQPELAHKLESAELEQLSQRTRFSVELEPFSVEESGEYIRHRLRVAGLAGDSPLPADIFEAIYTYTGGVPRLINSLCDTALIAAYAEDQPCVSGELLATTIEELGWVPFDERGRQRPRLVAVKRSDRPILVVACDGEPLADYAMADNGRLMIGRDVDNDISIRSEYVSRNHAQVIADADGWYWLKDLNSKNGVRVNGKRVRRRRLVDGDVIGIGRHQIVFHDPSSPAAHDGAEPADLDDFRETTVLHAGAEKISGE